MSKRAKEFGDRLGDRKSAKAFLSGLQWERDGLIPVVQQDVESREVLGMAFADKTALKKTLATGLMHYWSRSRQKYWLKGEESGHFQQLQELSTDCDGDVLLARVKQVKANCHLGFFSCFNYALKRASRRGSWKLHTRGKKVFDPKKVYASKKQK